MPRGYRCVILAAFGWLALAGAHPKPATGSEETQTDSRVGDALTNISATYNEEAKRAKSPPASPPCGTRQYQSKDDLCAQWKAADAAADAAWWAAFAGWFGGLSFLGVLAAIGLAFHSNWIARDTAKRQLRCYLHPTQITALKLDKPDAPFRVRVEYTNSGQTPAKDVAIFVRILTIELHDPDIELDPLMELPEIPDLTTTDATKVVMGGNGGTMDNIGYAEDKTNDQMMEYIISDNVFVYCYGGVIYTDIFGVTRIDHFRSYINKHTRLIPSFNMSLVETDIL